MYDGIDVKTWIKEKLVDSVICQYSSDNKAAIGDAEYFELCKANNCKYVSSSWWRPSAPGPVGATQTYALGVDYFAFFDFDGAPLSPQEWAWMSKLGHREEMANWDMESFKVRSIRLRKVGGVNVEGPFLQQAAYSGG